MCTHIESGMIINFHFLVRYQKPSTLLWKLLWFSLLTAKETRIHSSRMRTGRSLTVCRGGFSWQAGFCLPGVLPAGGVLPARGVSLPGGSPCRGVLPAGGFSLPEGGLPAGGVCLRHAPHFNRITDTSENITLVTTSLRPVNYMYSQTLSFE